LTTITRSGNGGPGGAGWTEMVIALTLKAFLGAALCLTAGLFPSPVLASDMYTALMRAAGANIGPANAEAVKRLLQDERDLLVRNKYGWMAIDFAALKQEPDIVDLLARTAVDRGAETTVFVTQREDYIFVGQKFIVAGKVKNFGKKTATEVVISVSCPVTSDAKKIVRCMPENDSRGVIASLGPDETKEFRIVVAEWYPNKGTGQTSRVAVSGYDNPASPIMGFFNPAVQVAHK
jgi:hypothetical protein